VTYDESSNAKIPGDMEFKVPGLFLGSYWNDDLHIVYMHAEDKSIRVLQFQNLKVVNEVIFNIDTNFLKKKNTLVSFLEAGEPVTSEEAVATVKLIHNDTLLYICADEPFYEYGDVQMVYKTTVFKLDLKSGLASTRFFAEPSQNFFHSIPFNGNLYRTLSGRVPTLQVFDLTTGKEKLFVDLRPMAENRAMLGFFADGKKRTVTRVKPKPIALNANYVIPDSVNSTLLLRLGFRYTENSYIPVVSAFGVVAAVVTAASNVMLSSLNTNPANDFFIYLKSSPDKKVEITADSDLIHQQISEYESKLTLQKTRLQLKAHLYGSDACFGIYQENKSNKLRIIRFSKQKTDL
jgi:hypothetical protein